MIRIGTTLTAPTGALFVAIGVATLLWGSALAAAPVTQSTRPASTVVPARQNAEKVTKVEGITEYRLANGLRVLLFPDQSKPTIVVNVTYLVGSRHENYGETGMAHLLEHLMFKGTPHHSDLPKQFNARGARFNGTTSLDRTNYYELFQANDDNLDWALGMEADRMVHSFIAKTVFVSMALPRGDEKSLFGRRETAALTGQMLMRGTSRYTREQLRDEFSKLKVNGGVNGQGATFDTTRTNVAAAIRLAAHVLREPSFPEAEFAQLQKQTITNIESQLGLPAPQAGSALAQHFNTYPKGDIRYAPSLQEQMEEFKSVSLDDVKGYYKTFYGADRAQIAIVGDFDEAEVVKAITESFDGWHSRTPYARVTRKYEDIGPINRSIETPDKENAALIARLNVDINEDDADYPALFVMNYILGGSAGFDSRLVHRIRVQDGLSYGVNSSLNAGLFDRAGSWTMSAIAAPQNIGRVESDLRDELGKLLKDGITPEELAKAKSGIAQQRAQSRAQDQVLVGKLRFDIDAGHTFAWDKQFEAHVEALTPEAVLAAARKYIEPAKISIVKGGDFAKVSKPH
jgi:predicted Zn-dependent peptidase